MKYLIKILPLTQNQYDNRSVHTYSKFISAPGLLTDIK